MGWGVGRRRKRKKEALKLGLEMKKFTKSYEAIKSCVEKQRRILRTSEYRHGTDTGLDLARRVGSSAPPGLCDPEHVVITGEPPFPSLFAGRTGSYLQRLL